MRGYALKVFLSLLLPILTRCFCPYNCVCTEEQDIGVECIRADLEIIPITLNPLIQILTLNHNNFKEVGSASFQFHPELIKVDLANNQLVGIQEKTFEAQKILLTLNLSYNKLSHVNNMTFYGLEGLEVLDLSANLFEFLDGFVFEHLPKLKKLNLSFNKIRSLDVNTFSGLNSLQSLNLHNNELIRIEAPAFSLIQTLVKLNLSHNRISQLNENSFIYFVKLSDLDLSYNQLKFVSEESFLGLNNLRTLKLNNVNLSDVPSAALARLIRLEDLELNENNFEEIHVNAFAGLDQLGLLTISQCPRLHKVQVRAFYSNLMLTKLDLSNNRYLSDIESGVFDRLTKLIHIKLENNNLQTVNLVSQNQTILKTLDLSGNPWTCDCSIYHLKMLIASKDTLPPPTCSDPPTLQGQPMLTANLSDCVPKEAFPSSISTSKERTVVVVSISVSMVLLFTALGVMVFHYQGKGTKVVRSIQETVCRRKEAGQGMNYQRSFVHQDTDYFVSLEREQMNNRIVPVTEL